MMRSNKLYTFTLSAALAFQPIFNAKADPTVSIKYANGTTRTIDCGLLLEIDGRLHLTSEAMTAIDINKQEIKGSYTRAQLLNVANDPKELGQRSAKNTYLFLVHLARMHKDCIAITASFEEKLGIENVEKIYGSDWRSKKACTLLDVTNGCKAAALKQDENPDIQPTPAFE